MDENALKHPRLSAETNSINKLRNLFRPARRKENVIAPLEETLQPGAEDWESRRQGETYHNYGNRICARATASRYTFSAFIHKIYNVERQAQMNNIELQEQLKNEIRGRISVIDENINSDNSRIKQLDIERQSLNGKIVSYNSELEELKANNGQVNRTAKIKLYFGGFILFILTLYLFIFYSSTFYSAFFKDFMASGSISVGTHMFDSHAIGASLSAGIGQLLFVLSAPIIFLSLGFALHYFSKEKGAWKILKIFAVIVVTFIFDCILAYSIAKNIYTIIQISTPEQMPDYTVSAAISDHNVWAVIFCGFIVYIIWGIVFSLTMTAYEELKSNKNEQIKVQVMIDAAKTQLKDFELQENEIKTSITHNENKKQLLMQKLNNQAIVHNGPIKVALNDFNAGWMAMMVSLNCSLEMQNEVQGVYKQHMNTLFLSESSEN